MVDVRDGVAERLYGDPSHPFTRGTLCAKVNHYLERVYHPDRVLHHLKRAGAKGEGRFVRTSWDEALSDIASRWLDIAERSGAEAILPYSSAGVQGLIQQASIDLRLFGSMGCSDLDRNICGAVASAGLKATIGCGTGINPEDTVHSRYIVLWGTNTIVTNLHYWPLVREAQSRGARIVVVDPIRTRTAEAARLRERHFEFFFNEFRGVSPILRGPHQLSCLRRLRIEQENVRAALEWALTSPDLAEKGVELAGALFWFWTKRGLFEEGKVWLERALAADAPGPLRAHAFIGLAHLHYFQGRHVEVGACADEALSLGREDRAWAVPFALFLRALAAFELGDYEHAAARCLEAREAANAGDPSLQAGPLMILANIAVASGDHDRAQQFYDESIEVCRQAGDMWALGILLSVAAGLRIVRGDFERACAQASEALTHCQELEDPRGIAWSLDVFAGLLAAGGHADGAARLWGASDGLLSSVGGSLNPTIGWIRDRYIERVKTSLRVGPFDTARAEGRAMSPAEAVALARQQTVLLRE